MTDVELCYDSPPSILATYPASFFCRKPASLRDGQTVPSMQARVSRLTASRTRVEAYNKVCGFENSDHLPITYPHILAMALQLRLLVHPEFPVRTMGLVHVANTITRYSHIPIDQPLAIRCFLEGHRESARGQEFDVQTEVRINDSLTWEESSVYLARRRDQHHGAQMTAARVRPGADAQAAFDQPGTVSTGWNVPAGIGRSYAVVSGDFNPIHLSKPSAMLLGFPAAIAHGMWSLARALAQIGETTLGAKVRIEARFKLPIFLPASVILLSRAEPAGCAFLLSDDEGKKPHLTGHCIRL